MTQKLAYLSLFLLFFSCKNGAITSGNTVTNAQELNDAIKEAKPGEVITMANGEWNDVSIRFYGNGEENKPITLKAETPGEVIIQGKSNLALGGNYLIVDGLYFTNGHSTTPTVIEFAINEDTVANHSQVINCVIKDFNKPQRNMTDIWVQFRGRHNQLDHSYISGKANRGPTVRVNLEGNQSINNHHKITNNHFGPRPPKGGASAETIQIGNSFTSMSPSYTLVANNLFDHCNGEVEIISSKTNFNEFRNNVFYKSEGSLVTRHGNYCTVDGNYFIGDENSEQVGGIRLIGTGHKVINNYFYNLNGKIFRSPLAVMNGIPKSPQNRYTQVTDVTIAYNSWINCVQPLQFGVGSNVDQRGVLPDSEIRSERPVRTVFANNLIFNTKGDASPIVAHDSLDGIKFKNNIINNQGVAFNKLNGLQANNFGVKEVEANIFAPDGTISDLPLFSGFEFDLITKDIFNNDRKDNNKVGAITGTPANLPDLLNYSNYGPKWYNASPEAVEANTLTVSNTTELTEKIAAAKNGDIIQLKTGNYEVNSSLKINKNLTITSADSTNKPTITYLGEGQSPLFEMNPMGSLNIKNIKLIGSKTQYAFASLRENMSSSYNLNLTNCEISEFDYILKGYKNSFAVNLEFTDSQFNNCNNGIILNEETDDKGDYSAENLKINGCSFDKVGYPIDYYRGGYDESTVGGNLVVNNSTFSNCSARTMLISTYGIINVKIDNNTFTNNNSNLIAQLWGAKNNSHSGNTIKNSGRIVVEENLKLKLLY